MTGGCSSIQYTSPTNYTKLCGQIKAYQYGSPDGLGPYTGPKYEPNLSVDDNYVDGVSITHGNVSRHHVWTYAAGGQEIRNGKHDCPCNRDFDTVLYSPPSFLDEDYYCESGKPNSINLKALYADDALWDGEQCGHLEDTCCLNNTMPWFTKTLNSDDSSPIEVRSCRTNPDEHTPIEIIEIYAK